MAATDRNKQKRTSKTPAESVQQDSANNLWERIVAIKETIPWSDGMIQRLGELSQLVEKWDCYNVYTEEVAAAKWEEEQQLRDREAKLPSVELNAMWKRQIANLKQVKKKHRPSYEDMCLRAVDFTEAFADVLRNVGNCDGQTQLFDIDTEDLHAKKAAAWPEYKDYNKAFVEYIALIVRENVESLSENSISDIIKRAIPDDTLRSVIEAQKGKRNELATRRPEHYMTMVDKVSTNLFQNNFEARETACVAMERKGGHAVTTFVTVDFDTSSIKGAERLSSYDKAVHNSICSLYVAGNEYITIQMIYRVMVGDSNARVTKRHEKEISDSISRCRHRSITIDATQEKSLYNMDEWRYEGNILYAEKVSALSKGKEINTCYRILKTPPLYQYAASKKHVRRIELKMLNTPLEKTKALISLQEYLLSRVAYGNKTIRYSTLFDYMEISTDASPQQIKNEKLRIRRNIRQILEHWKSNGLIEDFTEKKEGRTIASVSLIMPK